MLWYRLLFGLISAKVQVQTCQGPHSYSQSYSGLSGSHWLHAHPRANCGNHIQASSDRNFRMWLERGRGMGHWGPLPGQPRHSLSSPVSGSGWRSVAGPSACYQVFGTFSFNPLISSFCLCQSFSSGNLHSGWFLCLEFWAAGDKMNPVFLRTSWGKKKMSSLFSMLLTCHWRTLVSHALEKGTKLCFAWICIRDVLFVVPSENLPKSGQLTSLWKMYMLWFYIFFFSNLKCLRILSSTCWNLQELPAVAGLTLCQSQSINEDTAFDLWLQMINQIVTTVAGSSWPWPVWS